MLKTNAMPKVEVRINLTATRKTIVCLIPKHFNEQLSETGSMLETYKPSEKFLNHLGITGKRFYQLMRGQSDFMLCEAAAYAAWYNIPLSELYKFIPINKTQRA